MTFYQLSDSCRFNSGLLSSAILHIFLGVLSGLPFLWDNFLENPVLIESPPPIRLSLIRTTNSEKKSASTITMTHPEPVKVSPPRKEVLAKKISKPPRITQEKKVAPSIKKQDPVKSVPETSSLEPKALETSNSEPTNNQTSSGIKAEENSPESIEYEKALIYLLSKSKRYPERARRRGISGDGIIRLKLNKDGSILRLELAKSANSDILDEELINLVKRASPLPPLPDGGRMDFLIPVRFSLK